MGWDESAAKAVVTTIRLEHAPRNVRAYVRACRDDDLAALKPQPKQWHHVPVKEWPPWCGECENAVDGFVDVEDGRVARCPRCGLSGPQRGDGVDAKRALRAASRGYHSGRRFVDQHPEYVQGGRTDGRRQAAPEVG